MAGALRKDPAIEQFARMRDSTQNYFRINKKSGSFLLIVGVALPLAVGYLSYHTHGQIQLTGLRRHQPFTREFPQNKAEASSSD